MMLANVSIEGLRKTLSELQSFKRLLLLTENPVQVGSIVNPAATFEIASDIAFQAVVTRIGAIKTELASRGVE
jgi:hypothetical protein